MKIGIDARFYGTANGGLGRYASELIAELEKIDDRNEYIVFLRRDNYDQYEPTAPNFRKVRAEYRWYSLAEQILFPLFLLRQRLDLMHFTHFNVPLLYRRPFVVTVHDLILLHFPTVRATTLNPLLYRIKSLAHRWVIGSALRRAKTVLTVSEATKKDIVANFPRVNERNIAVTHCAGPNETSTGGKIPPDRRPPQPFALYVGNAYPHKNLEGLLRGFAKFRKRGHEKYHLLLVGKENYFYERLKEEAREVGLEENVTFFGQASDDELNEIYCQADFYVFPSLYEGFGIPPIEAMTHGVPVASSDRSCMPEVLGSAALYFDPGDTNSIAIALTRLTDDKDLRQRLITAGHRQRRLYSWRDTAAKTLATYERNLHQD